MARRKTDKELLSAWTTGVNRMVREGISIWDTQVAKAINFVDPPAEPQSRFWWFVGLASNALAFASCFYPPTAVLGTIWNAGLMFDLADAGAPNNGRFYIMKDKEDRGVRANGVLTKLGSGLGLVKAISEFPRSKDDGKSAKEWLVEYMTARADDLTNHLVDNSADWVKNVMIPAHHKLQFGPVKIFHNIPDWEDFHDLKAEPSRHKFIYENYIFPGSPLPGVAGVEVGTLKSTLFKANVKAMRSALQQFDQQYKQWLKDGEAWRKRDPIWNYGMIRDRGGPAGGWTYPHMLEDYSKDHPFEPKFKFPDLPDTLQKELHQKRPKISTMLNGVKVQ